MTLDVKETYLRNLVSKCVTPHKSSTDETKKSWFVHTQIYIDVGLLIKT